MEHSFAETRSRASIRAVHRVETLMQDLSLRLMMLRNTIAALSLAAYEREDDMSKLCLGSIFDSITALLPDEDAFINQLLPVADAFMEELQAEQLHVLSPDLLVKVIGAISGDASTPQDLRALYDTLGNGPGDSSAVLEAFVHALLRQGYDPASMKRQSPTGRAPARKASPQAQAPASKREKLTTSA